MIPFIYIVLVINDILLSNVRACVSILYCINILNPTVSDEDTIAQKIWLDQSYTAVEKSK